MNKVPPALESHLQGVVTNHCFVWIIRREDNETFGFTDHDRTLDVEGVRCDPQSGLTGSEASIQLGLAASGSDVEGALVSDRISERDIEVGLYDGARVEAYLVNWMQTSNLMLLHRWTIGKITRSGHKFIAEIKGAAAQFDKIHGRRILRQCDAVLGDARCGVNARDPRYAARGTVTSVVRPDIAVTGPGAYANGWFANGQLIWLTGANKGRSAFVLAHQGNGLRLRDEPVFAVQPGDTFSIVAGCDKSFAQCKAKFANSRNFRGFPHLPGNDAAYGYVAKDMDFDGAPQVP